jgi:hypothetical protein
MWNLLHDLVKALLSGMHSAEITSHHVKVMVSFLWNLPHDLVKALLSGTHSVLLT